MVAERPNVISTKEAVETMTAIGDTKISPASRSARLIGHDTARTLSCFSVLLTTAAKGMEK